MALFFMPSITGGSSTGIDYAPHMYVLSEGGDSYRKEDYIFVGNAETSYEDVTQYDATYDEQLAAIAQLATGAYCNNYHIGVSVINGLVGERTTTKRKVVNTNGRSYLTFSVVPESHRGIPVLEIPEAAKKKLIKVGLEAIGTFSGQTILHGLDVEVPTDLALLDFGKVFNGTPRQQAAERVKQERWQVIADELRQTLGIE